MTLVAAIQLGKIIEQTYDRAGRSNGYELTKEVRDWMSQNKIKNSFIMIDHKQYIHFLDPKDAVLFKLTWGGQ